MQRITTGGVAVGLALALMACNSASDPRPGGNDQGALSAKDTRTGIGSRNGPPSVTEGALVELDPVLRREIGLEIDPELDPVQRREVGLDVDLDLYPKLRREIGLDRDVELDPSLRREIGLDPAP